MRGGFFWNSNKILWYSYNGIDNLRYWISVLEISKQKSDTFINALIVFIDQIHHNLCHYILLFRAALGNHQRQGDQCIVIQKARTVSTVKNPIVFQEPKE